MSNDPLLSLHQIDQSPYKRQEETYDLLKVISEDSELTAAA